MSRYVAKPTRVEAIQYTGANWRDVAVEFLGLNEEFKEDDYEHNIFPSMDYRDHFLVVPQNLKHRQIRETHTVMIGQWVVVYYGEQVEVLDDVTFRSRFKEEP